MKFTFGDIVYHVPFAKAYTTGIDYLQIIEYDSVKQKYKCIDFDSLAPTSSMFICYIKEDELDFARNIDQNAEKYFKWNGKPLVPKNFDDLYYAVYDYDGLQQKIIRKAIKHRKDYEVPVKKDNNNK